MVISVEDAWDRSRVFIRQRTMNEMGLLYEDAR